MDELFTPKSERLEVGWQTTSPSRSTYVQDCSGRDTLFLRRGFEGAGVRRHLWWSLPCLRATGFQPLAVAGGLRPAEQGDSAIPKKRGGLPSTSTSMKANHAPMLGSTLLSTTFGPRRPPSPMCLLRDSCISALALTGICVTATGDGCIRPVFFLPTHHYMQVF